MRSFLLHLYKMIMIQVMQIGTQWYFDCVLGRFCFIILKVIDAAVL